MPGIPSAGYGYECELRSGEGWTAMFREGFLVLGGRSPCHLDLEEQPRAVEDVVEVMAAQAADGQALATCERWLTATAETGPVGRRTGCGAELAGTWCRPRRG
ncbi:hypothetical protein [Streptomyces sp. NPDC015350]|uniref:hypothetical protein n=1 Tax=Streptomyces sp. NPDC015350 TaxID=3364955 RepID=UPI0036FC3C30